MDQIVKCAGEIFANDPEKVMSSLFRLCMPHPSIRMAWMNVTHLLCLLSGGQDAAGGQGDKSGCCIRRILSLHK